MDPICKLSSKCLKEDESLEKCEAWNVKNVIQSKLPHEINDNVWRG